MAVNNAYLKYQEQAVNTATPGMLIIMLFEGAAKNINIAIKAIAERNIEAAHNAIIKTEEIYSALVGYLNNDVPMSADLKNWYAYILRRLAEANIKKDAEILREVLGFTTEFRDTWKEAEKKLHMKRARQ